MGGNTNVIKLDIDKNLRIITIPTVKNVFGVEGDIEVNRVVFCLPRYYCGFDMSGFSARVNYVNANKEANYYEADDVTSDDENVTFSWLMGPDVTAYAGDVKFSIKLYKKQNDKVIKVFNTKSGSGTVYAGLNVEDTVTPEEQQTLLEKIEADIKEDIDKSVQDSVSSISAVKDTAVNDINTAKDTAVNDINTAKDASLSEINSDTTTQQIQTNVQQIADLSSLIKAGTGELSVIIGNNESTANGHQAYAEGYKTAATGNASHSEGEGTQANGAVSHTEGKGTKAESDYTHAEGFNTTADALGSHAEGWGSVASGRISHAEGSGTKTVGNCSHAEGNTTNATGDASHAEGANTVAVGNCSHAEGSRTTATGQMSHAEGNQTLSTVEMSHAGGDHSEVVANGRAAFAHGCYTRALQPSQFVVGYGNDPCEDSIFEVGNGTLQSNDPANNGTEPYTRQNAFRVTQDGVAIVQTALKIGGTPITEAQLQALLNLLSSK